MKILFIGSRLFDDAAWYAKKLGIETIVTESNNQAVNLDLADKVYIETDLKKKSSSEFF